MKNPNLIGHPIGDDNPAIRENIDGGHSTESRVGIVAVPGSDHDGGLRIDSPARFSIPGRVTAQGEDNAGTVHDLECGLVTRS
jgi:hypothetical protein